MPLTPGDHVDRFEILDLLGAGGMGEVYRARDPRLERFVALKILRVRANEGSGASARLLREARAAAALSHPNVLSVYELGEIASPESLRGQPYLAMELIDGVTLGAHIGASEASVETKIGWMRDVARALAAAHAAGVIHRDIKPCRWSHPPRHQA
jgi:serine/threonine-protein kinase